MEARNTGASSTEHDIEGSLKWCLDAVRECSSTLSGTTSFGNVGDLDGLHDLIGVSLDKNRSAGAFPHSQSNLSAESSHNVLHNDESDFSLAAFAPLLNGSDDVIDKCLASLQEDLNELLHGCSPLPQHTNNPISSLTHNGDISEMGTSGSEPSTWFSMFVQSFECGVADIPATSPLIDFDHMHPDARHSQALLSNYAAEGDGVIHLGNNPEKQRLLAAASSYCTFIEKSEGKVLQHRCTKVPRESRSTAMVEVDMGIHERLHWPFDEEEAPMPDYCGPDSDALLSEIPTISISDDDSWSSFPPENVLHEQLQNISQASNGGYVDAEAPSDVMFKKTSATPQATVERSSSHKTEFKERLGNLIRSKQKPRGREKDPNLISIRMETDADVLHDDFKWRKYGRKRLKGSLYETSYYKCSSKQCSIKKLVGRLPHEPKWVVATYKGKHNHPPPNKNSKPIRPA